MQNPNDHFWLFLDQTAVKSLEIRNARLIRITDRIRSPYLNSKRPWLWPQVRVLTRPRYSESLKVLRRILQRTQRQTNKQTNRQTKHTHIYTLKRGKGIRMSQDENGDGDRTVSRFLFTFRKLTSNETKTLHFLYSLLWA